MNTYDDVKAFGADRYNGLVQDAKHEQLLQATRGEAITDLRPSAVRPSLQTLMLRMIRGIVGTVVRLGARP